MRKTILNRNEHLRRQSEDGERRLGSKQLDELLVMI